MDIPKTKTAKKPFSRRNLLIGAAALLLVGSVVALMGMGSASPSVDRGAVWIDTARQGDMAREIRASGVLMPRNVRWITAAVAATVQEIAVQPGAQVQADTVILRLTDPGVLVNLEKAKAALAGADADVAAQQSALASQLLDHQAALAKAESSYKISDIEAQARRRAEAAGVVSKLEASQSQITAEQERGLVDIERKRVDAFGRNLAAQMAAVRAKRAEAASLLEIAEQQAQALTVRAGIAGVVQQVDVEPGQRVAAAGNLARVARPEELIARLQVPEVQAKDIGLALPVALDLNGTTAHGHISRIDPSVKAGRVAVDVVFDKGLPAGARPDLSVDGRIVLDTIRGVTSIRRPAQVAQNGAGSLFVLDAGGDVYRRRPVDFGATSSDRVEVRSGLRPGDQVILSDVSQWENYETLRVR